MAFRIALYVLAAVSCLGLLSACGGGTSMSSTLAPGSSTGSGNGSMPGPAASTCSAAACGPALLTMTDAKGDFL
jgi:hypothetical protein